MRKLSRKIVLLGALAGIVGLGIVTSIQANNDKVITTPLSVKDEIQQPSSIENVDEGATENATAIKSLTETQLLYLIEEEKLAHDVYTVMYEKYGARVFGNILESESTHQSRVLTLLQAREIKDPRASEIGVFNNQELQALYDTLIKQGNESAVEAYNVGVAIEEKDIADISTQLATASDQDVIGTLEALRNGSENHLRAFNRQL